ncbi:MAG: YceI family protein [Acidimicrobiales bacterium]
MALPIEGGQWSLDPAHSAIEFAVRHLGISTVRGRFTEAAATLVVGEALDSSSLSAEIQMASVSTGNTDRDGHLQSTDIFNVETQPTMSFQSSSITETGSGAYRVSGDMTINGRTNTESFDATFFGTETFPMDGSTRAGFEATGQIDKTDYGIDFNVPLTEGGFMLSDKIDVTIHAQLVAPAGDG